MPWLPDGEDFLSVNHAVTVAPSRRAGSEELDALRHAIEHAAHVLPAQAPITVFVHHNTLHAFEDLPFHKAVHRGTITYGCEAYLLENRYRERLAQGRLLPRDLSAILLEDLGDAADRLIGTLGTRYGLRLAMLEHPLGLGSDAELRWLIAETDVLRKFRVESPPEVRDQMIKQTREWVMRDLRSPHCRAEAQLRHAAEHLFHRYDASRIEQWNDAKWEAFTLQLLWAVCRQGVHGVAAPAEHAEPPLRHRDLLLLATGIDIDLCVNDELIRFCAAFFDQGMAQWVLPERERGFFGCYAHLYANSQPVEEWLHELPRELERIAQEQLSPLEMIDESLRMLGVEASQRENYLQQTMLALRGWAGMAWQLETVADWAPRPAQRGTLVEYVAVRLLLERLALTHFAREALGDSGELSKMRARLRKGRPNPQRTSVEQRSFLVFQLAQVIGWNPEHLSQSSKSEWAALVGEIEAFSAIERRRIYHAAFERRYRNQALDALAIHSHRAQDIDARPPFQVVTCLDEREESFRRHLEEVAPECETFGVAGFFGVAMYYRGVLDAHFTPLCPIVIKPRHYVQEEVAQSLQDVHRRRTGARRAIGRASHTIHHESRSALGGFFAAVLGPVASFPLVARVLFPRLTARIRRLVGSIVQPPRLTRLQLERTAEEPGRDLGQLGYSIDEMVEIGKRVLRDIGLTRRFSRLVIITGHGSSSLNNPHESAYDCGACGGGRGGPNARACASLLNDPRVRKRLAADDLPIPEDTVFIGGVHDTCNDSIVFFDRDLLPPGHRDDFVRARTALDQARRRNAQERCRRFESAELDLTPDAALRHVESRSEDLSQVRPECGHATNAVCFVGRRWRTRGLFLDRRAFMASYDPTQDDEDLTILTRILQAVIPVCAGISLEYYFSYVDPAGYGCGTKLPHNLTSLVGVMDGAASDLRSGLPWQMVEIHEPLRLLFVIEATPDALMKLLRRNPPLERLVFNQWVQLAAFDPESDALHVFQDGKFVRYAPETSQLPRVFHSAEWFSGWRDHLGFAEIVAPVSQTAGAAQEATR